MSPSPHSQSSSTGTDTAGSNKHKPTRVTLSVPSKRKPLPKRFNGIPEDLQRELFIMNGVRMVNYKRQISPKLRGGHSRKRRKVSQQAAQEPAPTPISPTPSISETHLPDYSSTQRVLWESRRTTDFVNLSPSRGSCPALPSSQVGSHAAARPTQGHPHKPSSFQNNTTSSACRSHLYTMDSQQAADLSIPYNDQFLCNPQFTPSIIQPSSGSLPYEWPQSGPSMYSASHLPTNAGTQRIYGTPPESNSRWNATAFLNNASWEYQACAPDPYMSSSSAHRDLHNQQGLQYYPSSSHNSYNPSNDEFNWSGYGHPYQK
ncbi:hypothetical protein BJ165DRAFT_1590139 [Panaeolus papilionaceus]|nr:hypothetical protein BJ165DRAFT_1590139 [Panaeolus papilionaceus]